MAKKTINNRDHKRHDFPAFKWVKIVRLNEKLSNFKMYRLIDISQGGLSFVINNPDEFKRNDEFYILEIHEQVLDDPIRAKVKFIQEHDEYGVDFKVGVEFIRLNTTKKKS
jgi:c-di-GMP-binding flagellar brake protein YcgR